MSRRKTGYEEARDADLEASGLLDSKIVRKLGLTKVLGVQETEALTGIEGAMAYEIPYFAISGERTNYSRWKLISVGDRELPLKYYQEEKTIPRVYAPPLVDWTSIAADPKQRLVLTEGEKKAACACLHGLPTLGLGGVWNWKSKRWGYDVIPDFETITWRNRTVEICFDSDMSSNEQVTKAQAQLVTTLLRLGSRVYIRRLEPSGKGKTGLDDFIVAHGVAEYEHLQLDEAPQSRELLALNELVVYVEDINSFAVIESAQVLRSEQDVIRRFGTRKITSETGKAIPAAGIWVSWEHRRRTSKITYAPGGERFHEDCLNTWHDDGPKPKKGSVSMMLEIVQEIEDWKWLLQWLAYPVQNPGAKLHQAVLIWAVEQGTGKSMLGDVMCDVYGARNASSINSEDLQDGGYDWLANKQFVHGNEVLVRADKADMGLLKDMVTRGDVRVNIKYVPRYAVPNKANFYLTSNQPDAMRLEAFDRRFFVATLSKIRDEKFWTQMGRWRKEGGAAHWRYYLENEVDCKKFNPYAPPPSTTAKADMAYDSMSFLEQWCHDLVHNTDAALGQFAKANKDRDVFTVPQLMAMMPEQLLNQRGTVPPAVGRALKRAGAVALPSPVVGTDGKQRRLIAVRNIQRWKSLLGNREMWLSNHERGRSAAARLVVDNEGRREKLE